MSVIYPETPGDRDGPRLRPALPGFLLARYDELEERARAGGEYGRHWKAPGPGWGNGAVESTDPWPRNDTGIVVYDEGRPSEEQAEHIAQHDPAYVLADIAAKRAIVERETAVDRPRINAPPYNGPLNDPDSDVPRRHPELAAYLAVWGEQVDDTPVLRLLAVPFADHVDYDERWRP